MDKFFAGIFSRQPNEIINGDYYYGADSEGDQFDEVSEDLWLNQGCFERNWDQDYQFCEHICDKIAVSGRSFMDIACGPGMGLAPMILKKNPNALCLATDACSRLIKAWRTYIDRNLRDYNISLASFSALDMPIKDGSLDYVTSDIGLSSTRNGEAGQAKAISEVYRVLKPGGYFVTVENEWTDLGKIDEVFKLWGRTNWFTNQRPPEWHNKFVSAGFEIESGNRCFYRPLTKDDNDLGEAAEKLGIEIGLKYTLFILRKGK